MPPKKKTEIEQILEKAFDIVRLEGYDSLTARRLANELNCSTQPIYQAFSDMNELKLALTKKAQELMAEFIKEHGESGLPVELSHILGYVQFANTEKHLFQLIFTCGGNGSEYAELSVPKEFSVELDMIVYAHGIVMMTAFNTLKLPWESVREMIIRAYHSLSRKE